MNKQEKLISLILGAILVWYIFTSGSTKQVKKEHPTEAPIEATAETPKAEENSVATEVAATQVTEQAPQVIELPEEKLEVLENAHSKFVFTTHGAALKSVTFKDYATKLGEISDENPALMMDFSESPFAELTVEGKDRAAYEIVAKTDKEIVFFDGTLTRKFTIGENYTLKLEETVKDGAKLPANVLSLGKIAIDASDNGMLSVDSWMDGKVTHHDDDDSKLKDYLAGGSGGCGCGSARKAEGMPRLSPAIIIDGHQEHIALKNRFFVSALVGSSSVNEGFATKIARDMKSNTYRPIELRSGVNFAALEGKRESEFYIGPKKQSLLWDLDMKDTMEFGMWRWIGYPIVWLINFFTGYIPSVGMAIILLTVFLRLVFWPLTRKSTEGMKKMQEIQPKLKEIQAKFKDNPQRLQQETWAIYRDNKVNPLSSCLPLLIQIPVFIALYNVLKSAVELRYASFLWIADLSEPEGLFKEFLPFGGLNILPILMAVTMALQSALTPSTGDKSQQKMMIVFMPIMMLVMFYNFPAALALYWTLSQVLSIFQMWLMRRKQNAKTKTEVLTPDLIIDPPETRQMRRHK